MGKHIPNVRHRGGQYHLLLLLFLSLFLLAGQVSTGSSFAQEAGGAWTEYQAPTETFASDLDMLSDQYGWAVGSGGGASSGRLIGWDRDQWNVEISPVEAALSGVAVVSETEAWAVGLQGTILQWDGFQWLPEPSPTRHQLTSVSMVSADEGWAVGGYVPRPTNAGEETQVILRWDGQSWQPYREGPGSFLYEVKMLSSDDGWIVGRNGTILRWDGADWRPVSAPTNLGVKAVDMVTPDHGWAVGGDSYEGNGFFLRWNGSRWSEVASPIFSGLRDVEMVSADDGWATGGGNALLHWDGESWREVEPPAVVSGAIDAVGGDSVWFAASNGLFLRHHAQEALSVEACGTWTREEPIADKDARIQVTMVSHQTEPPCAGIFRLENRTDVAGGYGGYTLALSYHPDEARAERTGVVPSWNQETVLLMPMFDSEVRAIPADPEVAGRVFIRGELNLDAAAVDAAYYLIQLGLEVTGVGVACIDADGLLLAALESYQIIRNSIRLAATGDLQAAYDELNQVIDQFYERAIEVYIDTELTCAAEALEQLLGAPVALIRVVAIEMVWVGKVIYDHLIRFDGQSANVVLLYTPPAAGPDPTPSPQPTPKPPPEGHVLEVMSQIGGATNAIAVQENYLYAAMGSRLLALDNTEPATPQLVGHSEIFTGTIAGLVTAGEYAYIAELEVPSVQSGGLRIVDIRDPERMSTVSFHDIPRDAVSVTVDGNYAYVAGGDGPEGGLWIIDISDPERPVELGFLSTPGYISDVVIDGSRAYIADGGSIRVVDVSDPANPVEMGSLETDGYARRIKVVGDYAYVAHSGFADFRIFDVSNPANPIKIATVETPGDDRDVVVADDIAYVSSSATEGLTSVDVSDPHNPRVIGNYRSAPADMVARGNHLYIAGGGASVSILDISEPSIIAEVGRFDQPASVNGLVVDNDTVYLIAHWDGLRAVDVSDPVRPTEIGIFREPAQQALALEKVDQLIYLVEGGFAGLRIIDVSTPQLPQQIGRVATSGLRKDVIVTDNFAYLVRSDTGDIEITNVQNPIAPTHTGTLSIEGSAEKVAAAAGYLYVTVRDRGGMYVFDLSSPASPRQVAFYDTSDPTFDVTVVDGYAYVTHGNGLDIVSISDPSQLARVSTLPGPAGHVAVGQQYAVVGGGHVLHLIDISNPTVPRQVDEYSLPSPIADVGIQGNLIYVADGSGGFMIVRVLEGE